MKKAIAVILAIVFAISVLAGCSNGGTNPNSPNSSYTQAFTQAPSPSSTPSPSPTPTPTPEPVIIDNGDGGNVFNTTVDEFIAAWSYNFPDDNFPIGSIVDSSTVNGMNVYYYMITGYSKDKMGTWFEIIEDPVSGDIAYVVYCVAAAARSDPTKISTDDLKAYQAAIAILTKDTSTNYKDSRAILSSYAKAPQYTDSKTGVDYHQYNQDGINYRWWGRYSGTYYADIQLDGGLTVHPSI